MMVSNCGISGLITSASLRSGSRMFLRVASIRANAGDPVIRNRPFAPSTGRTAAAGRSARTSTSAIEGCASDGRTPSEIDALRSASRSMSNTVRPIDARTAATLTAVVVLPLPPLGLNAASITSLSAGAELRADDESLRRGADVPERITGDQRQCRLCRLVEYPQVLRVHDARALDTVGERSVARHETHLIVCPNLAKSPEERIAMRGESDIAAFSRK